MKLLRRHKTVLLVLGIYWPLIFWLTHIPVPDVARQSGMSDKTMHVLAYFALTFLVWFAVSPYHKVRWNRSKVWLVLVAVVWYGVIDEYLQSRVGRSADVMDFMANLFGVALGLGVLSMLGFWSALLTVSAVFIFIISNMSNLLSLYPEYYLDTLFHFTAYTAFTLIWIRYIARRGNWHIGLGSWLMRSLAAPIALLIVIKATTPLFDRPFDWPEVVAALFGMASAIPLTFIIFTITRPKK
ncbi:MAG: hypothetical protein B6I25_01520 [Planctomycetales bacterium 4572_13]|nr:MAG: hypothetical protein B6I25_01520 [Planctomycetales bacterium 4572_13]